MVLGERGCHQVSTQVGLRKSVQQQERRSRSADHDEVVRLLDQEVLLIKSVGKHRRAGLSGVMRGAVAGEYVETKVDGGIAPHRVSMVGIALGVVPLDQQSGTLQPVVVRLSGSY